MKVFNPIPARIAAIGAALAISPIPRNKNRIESVNRKRVSIDMNLNLVSFLFLSFVKRTVRANRTKRERSVIAMLFAECEVVPTRIPTRIRSSISMMSSRVPIPMILCPSFVFTSLNSSKIGINMASPTVAKDIETKIEISHE